MVGGSASAECCSGMVLLVVCGVIGCCFGVRIGVFGGLKGVNWACFGGLGG